MTDPSQPPGAADYAYKIAPIGRRVRVRVEGDAVSLADDASGRVLKTLSLHGLKAGRWSAISMLYAGYQTMPSRALTLEGPGGRLTLRQGNGLPNAKKGPNSLEFYAACTAVLKAAARLNPGLQISAGPPAFARPLIASTGLLVILFGVVMLAAAAGSLLTGEWLTALVLGAAALGSGAAGLITVRSFNPFKPRETISAADLAADLAASAGAPSGAGE